MPSTSEPIALGGSPSFFASIKGKIALANLASVLVLLVVAAFATIQFRELGKLLGAVSDGAEVLMRLSHAYDEREHLLTSYRKGYAEADGASSGARSRFIAVAEDLGRHTRLAREKLASGSTASLLEKTRADLESLELFDVYEGPQVGAGKRSLAYRLSFRSMERTLSDADINKIRVKIVRGLERDVGAAIRG